MTQFNGYPEEVILNAYDYSNPNYDLGFWRSHKLRFNLYVATLLTSVTVPAYEPNTAFSTVGRLGLLDFSTTFGI
jgi:hypothetical protein